LVIKPYFTAKDSKTSYLVYDEKTTEAILINLFEINLDMINFLENLKLKTLYITDKQGYDITGLQTLFKVYNPKIMTPEKNKIAYIGETEILPIVISKNEFILKIDNILFSGCVEYNQFYKDIEEDCFIYPANNAITTIKTIANLKLLTKEY